MKKKSIIIFLTIFLLVLFDQVTKLIASHSLINKTIEIIPNFLDFCFVKNTGAAFGILGGNIIVLLIISFCILGYLIYELKNNINNKFYLISLTLIISGALGNIIDRIRLKYVVDFIEFTLFNNRMPVFNVADICVTIGIILYILCIFGGSKCKK